MAEALLVCPRCRTGIPTGVFNTPGLTSCSGPGCNARLQVEVFPAFFRPSAVGATAENILIEGESSCFYHPQKKAVVPCESCGRFLCALCDVELKGQHLCPSCLESGKKKGRLQHLQDQRVLYDDIALALTTFPLLVWPFTFVTAPIALYLAIRHWNSPTSLIPRSKIRFIVAMILGGLQVIGWAAVIVAFARR